MKTISITDLVLVPGLSRMSSLEMIRPENDALLAPVLAVMGFDLSKPVEYVPCRHRNLRNTVVIDYLISGELDMSPEFLRSEWATDEDRKFAREYAEEEAARIAKYVKEEKVYVGDEEKGFESLYDNTVRRKVEPLTPEQLEAGGHRAGAAIESLARRLLEIRGTPFRNNGSRRLLGEVAEPEGKKRRPYTRKVK